jgi:hypothetical protein
MIKGTRLTFDKDGNPDTIVDSSSAFLLHGFDASHDAWVADSGAGNNGIYGVATAVAATLTLSDALPADESANSGVKLYKAYSVCFEDDELDLEYITPSICSLNIRLIEDL